MGLLQNWQRSTTMVEPTNFSLNFDNSQVVKLTAKIMGLAIIVLFVMVVFVLLLHLYSRCFWRRIEESTNNPDQSHRRRRQFVFATGQDPIATVRKGLDPFVLRSLPVLEYHSQDFKDGLECAVCLSELVEGEKARLLPKCNHGFHVNCIDMWFHSHSTCPVCRNYVAPESPERNTPALSENVLPLPSGENLAFGYVTEAPNFPTNVLVWGDETQVSSGGAGLEEGPSSTQPSGPPASSASSVTIRHPVEMMVIDIPNEMSSSSLSPSASRFSDDDLKSPVTTRMRSLKRLVIGEKRSSPSSVDIIKQPSRVQS